MPAAEPFERARTGIWALASLPIPAAAVWIWRESWWPPVVLVVWAIGAAALYIALERRKLRARNVRMLEHAQETFIRTLSHHRHDWMNDLQILYGYLRLNKPDKAAEIVDKIRERMESDSKISQLGNAELSTFLLSFRTICDHLRLDVKVADGIALDRISQEPETFAARLIGLINAVRYRAAPATSGENVLHLTLDRTEEAFMMEMIFEGEWVPGQSIEEVAGGLFQGLGHLTEKEGSEYAPDKRWRLLLAFPLTA